MSSPGLLTIAELAACVADGSIETVVAGFTDHYGRLCGKRLGASFFLETALEGLHACDYLLTVDMEMEPVAGYDFAGWEKGYGDLLLVPDLSTLRVADWLDSTALVLCDVHERDTDALVEVAPRTILRRQIDHVSALGLNAIAATELEYYLFKTSYRDAARSGYAELESAGWYREDYQLLQGARTEPFHSAVRRHLNRSGVPIEGSKGEWGRGQHELNLRYAEALTMADRHVVFKQCLKESADGHGAAVTFMAKPFADSAGSSCHVHLSLWAEGRNVFAENHESPTALEHFVGGCLARAAELTVLFAPTVNSYKRFVDGSWAPTRLAWSSDNRTTGFRVVGAGASRRIECRIPSADCNPYLALAGLLAAGLDGIKNEVKAPPLFNGDAYEAHHLPRLPRSLGDATRTFAESEFARSTFGETVVDHYVHFFRAEQSAYDRAVTDWERRRYFERI